MFLLIGIILVLLTAFYWYITDRQNYWKKKGVPGPNSNFPLGTYKIGSHAVYEFVEHYNNYKGQGPFCGLMNLLNPNLVALDPGFLKDMFIRDFEYFPSRGVFYNEKLEPLSGNMFTLEPVRWKILRHKLTPTFTSGKMKYMFPTLLAVADMLEVELKSTIEKNVNT